VAFFLLVFADLSGQTANDVLNILLEQNVISQEKADSLRADFSIKQQSILPDKKLRIDAEIRPRTEYRNGYQHLRNDSSSAAFFTNQRFRIGLNYIYDNRFSVQFSVQDLRVWGQQDPRSTAATLQVFEGWIEPFITDKFSVRIGRQRLIYDNQRLFAENDWRLSAAVHDALNFRYQSSRLVSEFALAFNQNAERHFGTDYSPSGFTNYKFLAVSYIRYKPAKYLTFTGLNSTDGYQTNSDPEKLNIRYTLGGRVEAESSDVYATVAAYYQGGKNPSGKNLSAYYMQPEIRYTSGNGLIVRLGAEMFSGNDNSVSGSADHSFVPLYGVAHRFNGSMDLITRFPADIGGAGLVNPYLFFIKQVNAKFDLRADFHTFHLKENFYQDDIEIDRYLGFENDFLITFKPNSATKVDLGVSYMLPTGSFALIKKAGSGSLNLSWIYLSLTFKPLLFNYSFK